MYPTLIIDFYRILLHAVASIGLAGTIRKIKAPIMPWTTDNATSYGAARKRCPCVRTVVLNAKNLTIKQEYGEFFYTCKHQRTLTWCNLIFVNYLEKLY